ncbi:Ger(x)C family spore germination protein [Heliobacterium gestii]|uniref:Ger(X)C family spore germination protein n=1 Tax=Heliomicrobium gestii TaxID=2699 RepID=A0A845L8V4_HELGE|nr:Ger(x)C family spore germination protein [Heliomicrobium gestii]MBM7865775.1 Ger(x)C family germination protein [Heliomicrobium gestii]MZP42021.1 Ger(x)C family spore germination protein [Heliomicrobium gestii]
MSRLLLLLIGVSATLAGCFSYQDIDKVLFTSAVLVDVAEDGSPILYFEAFHPQRGSTKETQVMQRLIFKTQAKTVGEAINQLSESSALRVNFTQNRTLLFTRRAAERGLETFIDSFDRREEFLVRTNVLIYDGDPEALMNVKLKGEQHVGIYLYELLRTAKTVSSKTLDTNIREFLTQSLIGDHLTMLPLITVKRHLNEDKVSVEGIALLQDYRLKDTISTDETLYLNFLRDEIRRAIISVPHPTVQDKHVTLLLTKSDTTQQVSPSATSLSVWKRISCQALIRETEVRTAFTNEQLSTLEKNVEDLIASRCKALYEREKQRGIDIIGARELAFRYCPGDNRRQDSGAVLTVEAKVTIRGSTDTKGFGLDFPEK